MVLGGKLSLRMDSGERVGRCKLTASPSRLANPPIQTPKQDYYPVLLSDATGHEDNFNLQTQGIELVRHKSTLTEADFDN